jgi:hypothetical protein
MTLTANLNRTRPIGVEYECAVPIIGGGGDRDVQETIANILNANGIRACWRSYSRAPVPDNCDVMVERDASISGERRFNVVRWSQIEVKTRILDGIDDWETVVPKTLEILSYCGGRVTPSCGHHVHVAFAEVNCYPKRVRSLWNLLHRFDAVLYGLLAPSRRTNTYCRPMPSGTKLLHGANSIRELRRRLSGYDRFQALNLTHLFGDGPRIEFRHHQGTLNPTKSRHWIRLMLALVEHACRRNCMAAPMSLPNDRKSLDALLTTIGLKVNTKVYSKIDPDLRETGKYVLQLWKKFNGNVPLNPTPRAKLKAASLDDHAAVVEQEAA